MTHPSIHRVQCHLPIVHNLLILTSIQPFTIHSSIHLCIYPSVHMICSPSLLPSVHRSVHSSTHPSLTLSIHLPICSLFPICPPICPLSITPEHTELLDHLSVNPTPPACPTIVYPCLLYLFFRIIPLSIYAVCLPGHPSIHYPPIHHLFVPPFIQTFVHCPPLTTHLLVILYLLTCSFMFLLTCVPTHLPNYPSIHPSSATLPPPIQPFNQPPAHFFFCIFHIPTPTPPKQLQLFPEEMKMAFLISPISCWSPSGSPHTLISRIICFAEQ